MKDSVKGGISNFRRHIKEVLLFASITLFVLTFFTLKTHSLVQLLAELNIKGIALILLCILLLWFANTAKFHLIARLTNVNVGVQKSFEIVLASIFASNITPYYSGLVASQIYFVSKFGESAGLSAAISSIYLILRLIVAVLLSLIFIFSPHQFIKGVRGDFYVGLIVFVFLFTAVVMFSMFFPEKLKKLVNKLKKIFSREPLREERAEKFIDTFNSGLRYFIAQDKLLIFLVVVLSFIGQILSILIAPLSFVALGLKFDFYEVFLIQIAVQFAASAGITPGGIGIIEGVFAGFFYPLAQSFTSVLTIVYRIASFYLPTLVGAFFFFKLLSEPKIRN